ncbi:MAG: hypothetical protein GY765_36700 [bacterium]|nr:hypothetical protein [bacterium]
MDNIKQVREIKGYCLYLSLLTGRKIPIEVAAAIWIRKYADVWRLKHPALR